MKQDLQSPANLFPQVQARESQGDIIQLLSFFKIVFVEILLKVQCTSHLGINFILSTIYMSRHFDTSNQSCSFFSVLFSFSMQQRKFNCFFLTFGTNYSQTESAKCKQYFEIIMIINSSYQQEHGPCYNSHKKYCMCSCSNIII